MALPIAIPIAIGAASVLSNMYDNYKNREAASNAYEGIADRASDVTAANQADIQAYLDKMYGTYGQGASQYSSALQDFLDSDVYQNEGFSYDNDISNFYDPAANQRVAAAMDAINNASATGGNRFSSDYINRVGAKQQAMASEEWEKAYSRLMQDRQQQMSEWSANSQNAWNNYNAEQARKQAAVDAYGNDRDQIMQGFSDATMAGMNNRTANLQTQASVLAAQAQNNQGQNPLTQILNPIASFMGSYYGG